jgi:hypothetical protein
MSWAAEELVTADSCLFRGGAAALELGTSEGHGTIVGNVFEDAPKGLRFGNYGDVTIQSNVVRRTSGIGMQLDGQTALITGNDIRDCGVGLWLGFGEAALLDNTILHTANTGVYFLVMDQIRAERNQIGKCAGSAVYVQSASDGDLRFTQNTLHGVAGSCLVIADCVDNVLTVEGNIGFAANGYGLQVMSSSLLSATVRCNDWFANGLGRVSGVEESALDMSFDPGFCDVAADDVGLYSDSPLLSQTQCEGIGARGVGCSPPTLKALNVSSNQAGLELVWQFDAVHPVESWIERADQAGGRWDSLGTGSSSGSNSFGLLDRAVAPDHAYNYRVAWRDRGTLVHGSPVSGSWIDAGRLSSVSPNPAIGEINVDWVLSRPGVTDIRVYDLAGREIAVVARGSFNVGRNRARWDGQWAGRGVAPAGMYVVRITTSERTASHRVLLIR